jgi:hypothetical protein
MPSFSDALGAVGTRPRIVVVVRKCFGLPMRTLWLALTTSLLATGQLACTSAADSPDAAEEATQQDGGELDAGLEDAGEPDGGTPDGGPGCPISPCIAAGELCAPDGAHDQCCNQVTCAPDATGTHRCGTEGCVPEGTKCKPADDCCSGTCVAGKCQSAPTCLAKAQTCTSASQCCSGYCGIEPGCTHGTCQGQPPFCLEGGSVCQFDDQCCIGLCLADAVGSLRCSSQ